MKVFDNLNFMKPKANDFNKIFYYATYDNASQSYSDMFPARTDLEAKRMVADVVNTPKTIFNIQRKDLELFLICSYDIRTAKVLPSVNKICNLSDLYDSNVYDERYKLLISNSDFVDKNIKEKKNGTK